MHIRPFVLGIIAVFLPQSPAAANDVAYRWVDEDGVTNFSDTPPATHHKAQGDVEPIALPGNFAAVTDPANDYYSISNQWKRLYEERIEREKLALERERVRLERSRTELAAGGTVYATPPYVDTAPLVVYGGIPRFVGPRPFFHGRPALLGTQPDFFHGVPRHDFKHRRQKFHSKISPVHHGRGEIEPNRMFARPVKFKCC